MSHHFFGSGKGSSRHCQEPKVLILFAIKQGTVSVSGWAAPERLAITTIRPPSLGTSDCVWPIEGLSSLYDIWRVLAIRVVGGMGVALS